MSSTIVATPTSSPTSKTGDQTTVAVPAATPEKIAEQLAAGGVPCGGFTSGLAISFTDGPPPTVGSCKSGDYTLDIAVYSSEDDLQATDKLAMSIAKSRGVEAVAVESGVVQLKLDRASVEVALPVLSASVSVIGGRVVHFTP